MTLPYYSDDLVTIYHGDASETVSALDQSFDLVFTSPPYNLGVSSGGGFGHYTPISPLDKRGGHGKWVKAATAGGISDGYADHDDAMPMAEYEAWQRAILSMLYAHLTTAGAIFYNHKPRVQARTLWTPLRLVPEHVPLRQIIIWARAGGMNFAPTHYVPTHEWILVLAKSDFRLRSKGASGVGDVWRVPQEANPHHPAPFPVGLPARAIETVGPEVVLDPFMGSGSTLIAAKAAGVRAVGIELSERYCEVAATRCSQEVLGLETA